MRGKKGLRSPVESRRAQGYYSAIERITFELVLMRWMKLDHNIQNEIRERKKTYINAYIWHLEKQ